MGFTVTVVHSRSTASAPGFRSLAAGRRCLRPPPATQSSTLRRATTHGSTAGAPPASAPLQAASCLLVAPLAPTPEVRLLPQTLAPVPYLLQQGLLPLLGRARRERERMEASPPGGQRRTPLPILLEMAPGARAQTRKRPLSLLLQVLQERSPLHHLPPLPQEPSPLGWIQRQRCCSTLSWAGWRPGRRRQELRSPDTGLVAALRLDPPLPRLPALAFLQQGLGGPAVPSAEPTPQRTEERRQSRKGYRAKKSSVRA